MRWRESKRTFLITLLPFFLQYQLIPPKNWLNIFSCLFNLVVYSPCSGFGLRHTFWWTFLLTFEMLHAQVMNLTMLQFEKYFRETSWPSFYFCSSWNVDCCSNPDAVISYPIVSPEMIPCAREADNPWCWMAANPPPALLSLCPPSPTHTLL